MITLQTAIPTIDKPVMTDLLHTQFLAHGYSSTIYTAAYKGVPLYLLTCANGIQYVCTRGQILYFTAKLSAMRGTVFTYVTVPLSVFRVVPAVHNNSHGAKGAQYGVTYTHLGKAGYSGCLRL